MSCGSYSHEAGRPLTAAMLEVGRCAARGLTIEATAAELGRSVSTVRTERAALIARLGPHVTNITGAGVELARLGEL